MRALLQRVSSASITVRQSNISAIGNGLLIFLGMGNNNELNDIAWLCGKVANLRIFSDSGGKMNLSLKEVGGDALVVSQFTLYASTKKGNRPSFLSSAQPQVAEPLYEEFCKSLEQELGKPVPRGVFGADMQVTLVNDGPVSIWLDSRNRE